MSGLIAAVAASLLLVACDSREERAGIAAARADQLLQAGNPMAASIEIRKALAERDDVAAYWLLLARTQMLLQKYGGAYSAYLRVLELDRGNMEALQTVAELSFAGGNVDDADKYADQVLALDTQNIRALLVKGSTALKRKKLDDAEQFAAQVLRIDPANEGGLMLRGRILAEGGKPKDAIALIEQALAARGNSQGLLGALLDLYKKVGDDTGVERTYARLFTLAPDNAQLRLGYARELYLNGKADDAAGVVAALRNAKPGDAALQNGIVDLWIEVGGDPVSADEIRRTAAQGSPTMKVALARYLLETGKPAEAEQLLQPFASAAADDDVSAGNVEPSILYAMAQNELGHRRDAFARANAVLAFDETNPRALMLRARILTASGSFDAALKDARVLVRDNPELEAPRAVLARLNALRGDGRLADATFQQALKDFPAGAETLSAYLDFLIASDARPQAVQTAAQFTTRNPDLAAGWKVVGRHCVTLANADCVKAATTALAGMRGGPAAQREIAAAAGARDRAIARLSPELGETALKILRGQVRAGPVTDQLLRAGRAADAEALARALIAIDPADSLAPALLGEALVKRGDRAGGERQLQATLAKFPGQPRAYADLARMRFDAGDRAGGFAVLNQGLDRMKGHPALLKTLARLQERSGQPAQAIATYRSLLQNAPDDMIAINNLAALLTDYGPRPEALGEAELLARRLLPADNPIFLDTRGWLKLQRGERAEAVRLLRQATAGEGGLPIFDYHLAEALAASGDRPGARAAAARAVAAAEPGEPWLAKARALMGRA